MQKGLFEEKNAKRGSPGRIFSYCVRARAYTHVLARVYSTRASTCILGLSEIGAEGQKVQKSKLVTFFLL